jgi:DNA-binding response OmpR family regulator
MIETTCKVMLVDDDQFLLDLYAIKFKAEGYDIDAILDPVSALKKLRDGYKTDAIILDAVMPGVNGLELLKAIRDEKLGGDPVLIMLTNQSQEEDIEAANKIGIDGYIVKSDNVPSEVIHQVTKIITDKKQVSNL